MTNSKKWTSLTRTIQTHKKTSTDEIETERDVIKDYRSGRCEKFLLANIFHHSYNLYLFYYRFDSIRLYRIVSIERIFCVLTHKPASQLLSLLLCFSFVLFCSFASSHIEHELKLLVRRVRSQRSLRFFASQLSIIYKRILLLLLIKLIITAKPR